MPGLKVASKCSRAGKYDRSLWSCCDGPRVNIVRPPSGGKSNGRVGLKILMKMTRSGYFRKRRLGDCLIDELIKLHVDAMEGCAQRER
jgi:hypothetical protein